MKITHIALWTEHLEELREFYGTYFGGRSGGKYVNPAKRFESYQLAFDGECRLELMRRSDINGEVQEERIGLAHFAFACADREAVVALTERLRADGYQNLGEPRPTVDANIDSDIADPDGNLVEITC